MLTVEKLIIQRRIRKIKIPEPHSLEAILVQCIPAFISLMYIFKCTHLRAEDGTGGSGSQPLRSCVETLSPSVMVVGGGASGSWSGFEGVTQVGPP